MLGRYSLVNHRVQFGRGKDFWITFTWTGLRHIKQFNLGGNLSRFIVYGRLVLLGNVNHVVKSMEVQLYISLVSHNCEEDVSSQRKKRNAMEDTTRDESP